MGLRQSPKLVTDGLIFHFDMQNTEKSYKGMPITNQFLVPTPDSSNNVTFSVQGTGTFKRVFEGTYGGYSIKSSDVVYRYDLGGAGCHYHGNDTTITSGYYATWQFDYFISSDASALVTDYLANMENTGSGIGGAVTVGDNTKIGKWNSVRYTVGPATSTSGLRLLLYPGACASSYLTATGYILFKNPAVWYTSFSPTANIPFVSGTRSTSQSILDPIGKNTITATSLTYAADGTFSFNGSSDMLIMPENSAFNTQNPTVEVWIKTNSLNQNGFFFEKGQVNTQYSLFQEGTSIVWRTHNGTTIDSQTISSSNINTTNYWHIVATIENGNKKIYVNGQEKSSTAWTSTIPTNANGCSIGVFGGFNGSRGYYFNGIIGSVKVYNRGLTESEIQQNFNALRGRYGI